MAHERMAQFLAATLLSAGLAGTLWVGLADLCKRAEPVNPLRAGLLIAPEDAAAWARLAAKTIGAESLRALETAVLLNPRDSRALLDLALRSEKAGDGSRTRDYLDRAIKVDRGYLPLWTAANVLLRYHDDGYATFLHAALTIATKGAQDPNPLFDLAWQAGGDAQFIANRIVGAEAAALRLYIAYLSAQQRFDALATAAIALAEKHEPADRPLLSDACEFLLKHSHEPQALELWNRMSPSTLNRNYGDIVTNGAMNPPLQIGFDWKFNSAPNHVIDFQGPENGVRIEVNGNQPDILDLLRQPLPVSAGQQYELRWQALSTHPARLLWLATSGDADAPFARAEVVLNKPWSDGRARIAIPAGVQFASLVLRLERNTGEARNPNAIRVRGVGMQHAQ